MTIRLEVAHPSQIERLVQIHSSAFPDGRGFPERRANFMDNPRGALSDLFVARDAALDDAIVGHGRVFSMKTWIAGGEVQVGGVASIAVAPEARGRGVGKAIVKGLLEESARRGDAMQMLFPFSYAFYASLGCGATSPLVRVRVPTRALPTITGARCRPVTSDDHPAIRRVYAEAARRGNGMITRSEALFARLLAPPAIAYVALDDSGTIEGYVLFTLTERKDVGEGEMHVRELVASNARGRLALFTLLRAHRDQVQVTEINVAIDDPLLTQVREPRPPRTPHVGHLHPIGTVAAGPMVRVVDAKKLAASRGYREDGRITVRVIDALCGDATFAIEVREGRARCEHFRGDPELECDASSFSAMLVGSAEASEEATMGRVKGEGVGKADALFATGAAFFCADEF